MQVLQVLPSRRSPKFTPVPQAAPATLRFCPSRAARPAPEGRPDSSIGIHAVPLACQARHAAHRTGAASAKAAGLPAPYCSCAPSMPACRSSWAFLDNFGQILGKKPLPSATPCLCGGRPAGRASAACQRHSMSVLAGKSMFHAGFPAVRQTGILSSEQAVRQKKPCNSIRLASPLAPRQQDSACRCGSRAKKALAMEADLLYKHFSRRGGGIGRHAVLRWQWRRRASSSLALDTSFLRLLAVRPQPLFASQAPRGTPPQGPACGRLRWAGTALRL